MRPFRCHLLCCLTLFLSLSASSQTPAPSPSPGMGSTFCTFDDGKQISVRYANVEIKKNDKVPFDKVWTPENSPIFLFTQTPLKIGNVQVPVGAFSLFIVPGKTAWTLIVNKGVKSGSPYDQKEDLGRVSMEIGTLPSPNKQFTLYLGHFAPRKCTLRIDYGVTRAFADIEEL